MSHYGKCKHGVYLGGCRECFSLPKDMYCTPTQYAYAREVLEIDLMMFLENCGYKERHKRNEQ